ncbi:MAG: RDD family protein [Caldilineaceae bacterium]|nr:RDD family protein [Caldilineaceae bacterium]
MRFLIVRRSLAYVVDIVLLFFVLAPLGFLLQWLLGIPPAQTGPAIGRTILWHFSLPVWIYFVLCDHAQAGATLGKRLLKIGVRTVTEQRLGWGQALGRTVVKLLPWELVHLAAFALSSDPGQFTILQTIGLTAANLLTLLYFVVAVITRGRRSIHDFLVGTVVQQSKR